MIFTKVGFFAEGTFFARTAAHPANGVGMNCILAKKYKREHGVVNRKMISVRESEQESVCSRGWRCFAQVRNCKKKRGVSFVDDDQGATLGKAVGPAGNWTTHGQAGIAQVLESRRTRRPAAARRPSGRGTLAWKFSPRLRWARWF